jgi:hypothetical protein
MAIYILCPRVRTGGPECLHQLCDECNAQGMEAYLVYIEYGMLPPGGPPLYADTYDHLLFAPGVPDVPNAPNARGLTVVVPEIFSPATIQALVPGGAGEGRRHRLIWWWLSWDHGAETVRAFQTGRFPAAQGRIEHAFQSRYAQTMAAGALGVTGWHLPCYMTQRGFDGAPRESQATQATQATHRLDRLDAVVYNATKDKTTPRVCERLGVRAIGLKDMTREEVVRHLSTCKLYVDFGGHPGRDRMPCEAALLGCVVVTNTAGSAGNEEDMPIAEKCEDEAQLEALLPRALADYERLHAGQAAYRRAIRAEHARMRRAVRDIFSAAT